MTKTIPDVICPFCGTLCDDLEVVVSDDGKKIEDVYNACVIGAAKFMHAQAADWIKRPRMQQPDGSYKEVSYDEAVEFTAQMLAKAKKPLMYGWSSTSCEAQSVGHEIAEKVGAIVDNTATGCHGTTLIAVQDVGIPSCTLGEIKNRADRIIFWGCNPTLRPDSQIQLCNFRTWRVNGALTNTGNIGTNPFTILSLGHNETEAQDLDGYIAEAVAFSDAANQEIIEGYLAWKWGMQGNLPPTHPYKNFPPKV